MYHVLTQLLWNKKILGWAWVSGWDGEEPYPPSFSITKKQQIHFRLNFFCRKHNNRIKMSKNLQSVIIWKSFHPTLNLVTLLLNSGQQIFGGRGQKNINGQLGRNVYFFKEFWSNVHFFVNTCQSTYEFVFRLALGDLECSWRSQRSKRSNFWKCCKLPETHGELIFYWKFNCKPLFWPFFVFEISHSGIA